MFFCVTSTNDFGHLYRTVIVTDAWAHNCSSHIFLTTELILFGWLYYHCNRCLSVSSTQFLNDFFMDCSLRIQIISNSITLKAPMGLLRSSMGPIEITHGSSKVLYGTVKSSMGPPEVFHVTPKSFMRPLSSLIDPLKSL